MMMRFDVRPVLNCVMLMVDEVMLVVVPGLDEMMVVVM
jgi:hypothetical protein